jgi:hypothetical protein
VRFASGVPLLAELSTAVMALSLLPNNVTLLLVTVVVQVLPSPVEGPALGVPRLVFPSTVAMV